MEPTAPTRPVPVHVPKIVELERVVTTAYQPAVEALAQRIKNLPVDSRPDEFEIEVGTGRPPDVTPEENIELTAVGRLVPAESLSSDGSPSYMRIGSRVLPIGEYGQQLTWTVAEAFGMRRLLLELPNSAFPNQNMFRQLGIRTNVSVPSGAVWAEGNLDGDTIMARRTALFGLFSLFQSAIHFSAYKVPGFNDPFELLKSISSRAFVELGARSPIMVIAPMSNRGFFFPGPVLRRSGPNATEMSGNLRDFLVREQRAYHHDLRQMAPQQQVERTRGHTVKGRGCPVNFEPLVEPAIDWIYRRQQFTGGRCEP